MAEAQLSFHELFRNAKKEARHAELSVIREAIDDLSPEERRYLGIGEQHAPAEFGTVTIVREMEPQPESRKAKRKVGKSDAAWAREHLAILKQQDVNLRSMSREASQIQVKKQRDKELQERKERRDKKAKDSYRAPGEFHIKEKEFVPVIGQPNAKGETPVQLDAKTTIYVAAGKNVQERITLWLRNLKR